MEERNITTTTAATESQAITTNAGTQEAAISDERIPGKLICTIMAVVIVIVFVAMLHALRNRK